jgi:hypothetical protein
MKRAATTTIVSVMLVSLGAQQLMAAVRHLPEDVKASLSEASGFRTRASAKYNYGVESHSHHPSYK